jgi:hypothetical protein
MVLPVNMQVIMVRKIKQADVNLLAYPLKQITDVNR